MIKAQTELVRRIVTLATANANANANQSAATGGGGPGAARGGMFHISGSSTYKGVNLQSGWRAVGEDMAIWQVSEKRFTSIPPHYISTNDLMND